jgi:hypothetical protein
MALVRTLREGEQIRMAIGGRDVATVIVQYARNGRARLVLQLHPATLVSHEAAPPKPTEAAPCPSNPPSLPPSFARSLNGD